MSGNNEGQGPPQGDNRPPWASGADFQAPGTQPPPQAAPPWASGAPYVQYPPPGALPVVPLQQYPPGAYAPQFVPNAPMLYAVPPMMQMPPQPMEESSENGDIKPSSDQCADGIGPQCTVWPGTGCCDEDQGIHPFRKACCELQCHDLKKMKRCNVLQECDVKTRAAQGMQKCIPRKGSRNIGTCINRRSKLS